jgi:5-methylthioadenosine/S-adenosylhomocysteine deaminase
LLFSPFQAVAAKRLFGTTSVERLNALGFLDELTSFAHVNWITDHEVTLLANAHSTVVHCPGANLRSALGIAPVPELIDAGCSMGLGLDGSGFEASFDMLLEMRLALLLHQRPGSRIKQLSARDFIRMATVGAANALGMPMPIGQLTKGAAADLLVIDASGVPASPYVEPPSPERIVIGASASNIEYVMVDGVVLAERGSIIGVDMTTVEGRVRESVERMVPLLFEADEQFRAIEGHIAEHFEEYDLEAAGLSLSPYGYARA